MAAVDILLKTPGERARYLRKKKNLSVEQLAELSGVPVKQIRRLENNEDIRVDMASAIAIALDISPNKLMSGINEPREEIPELPGSGTLA